MTDQQRPKLAPGCFGSVICIDMRSGACRKCDHKAECSDVARESVDGLSYEADVSAFQSRVAFAEKQIASGELAYVIALDRWEKVERRVEQIPNKKSRALAERIIRDRVNVRGRLQRQENPFDYEGARTSLRLACQTLIETKHLTRAALRTALRSELGWSYAAAASEVATAISVLRAFDAVREHSGVFILNEQ